MGATGYSPQTAEGRLGGAVNGGKFHWSLSQKVQVTLGLLGAAPPRPMLNYWALKTGHLNCYHYLLAQP